MRQTDKFIKWYDGALEGSVCGNIIQRFENDDRTMVGMVSGNQGPEFEEKKQTTELILPDEGWSDIKDQLRNSLVEYLGRYQADTKFLAGSDHSDLYVEPFRLKKYEIGGQFHWHIDCNSAQNRTRCLAIQWYFNTVENGGCTEFEDQEADITPVEGRLAFFPVAWMYRHRGAPPVSGPKYVCTTFVHPQF